MTCRRAQGSTAKPPGTVNSSNTHVVVALQSGSPSRPPHVVATYHTGHVREAGPCAAKVWWALSGPNRNAQCTIAQLTTYWCVLKRKHLLDQLCLVWTLIWINSKATRNFSWCQNATSAHTTPNRAQRVDTPLTASKMTVKAFSTSEVDGPFAVRAIQRTHGTSFYSECSTCIVDVLSSKTARRQIGHLRPSWTSIKLVGNSIMGSVRAAMDAARPQASCSCTERTSCHHKT